MILFEHVTKTYDDGRKAIDGLSFEIQKGEFFVLIGPSGCGKTTVLKTINRLIETSSGQIRIEGRPVDDYKLSELRWNIGYVLQQIALFPHMTVGENVALVPELMKKPREEIEKSVNRLLGMVGLDPDVYRDKLPSELSGGQQQRVGVVRALAADPDILLMDEPFSALDPVTREKLQNDLLELQRSIRKTIVFVTHDMREAIKLGDRVCLMNGGKIVQIGSPDEIVQHPANDFVREFLGDAAGSGTHREIASHLTAEELAEPLEPDSRITNDGAVTIGADTALGELLWHFAAEKRLLVRRGDEVIGLLDRERTLKRIAREIEEGGEA
ncbi:ABC transporter ATP-binding protein [Saccharibacillus endophyticus]|uniref:Glycine/betaine ABC transporter ATP-binding protein n=1 Tax=Saccharibacillus endophyticus TaxID=2060666 RepID=A0ABQ1ZTE4_9BACL|nr:ABC transporter ATP-binding protein [Saccharibacillus endophyticus]GGH76902.1 glycine/betaine ABC transporter ATP-binding protein [Saccharibacillus endophyticus]